MSENNIYSKAIPFIALAAVVILIGTIITVFVPMMMKDMHPKLSDLNPYTAIELAGRDVYQAEGCFNCHTQTVRPLKADVMAYGEYSKAGESYYEHPFLWGSKRTGPDLARIGGKYTDDWHYEHFIDPQIFFPLSNMPKYTWLEGKMVDADRTEVAMKRLKYPYTADEIEALRSTSELDALIAYMQVIGTAVPRESYVAVDVMDYEMAMNPLSGEQAHRRGEVLYNRDCANCHGVNGVGTNVASSMDMIVPGISDGQLFLSIANGLEGLMPPHINFLTKNDIWSIVVYTRTLAGEDADTAEFMGDDADFMSDDEMMMQDQ